MICMKNVFMISRESEEFPQKLKDVRPKIKRLYGCGDISLLYKKAVSVVGARNYSAYGKKMAEIITGDLVKSNIVIVSGMAVGIDTIAHETCIGNGGKTIAVLGSGLNRIYPKENIKLFHKIIESGGLVLSEYPLDEVAQKQNFPKRNRIVSGISEAVLVIEGAYRSGTSITAHCAMRQGKKVFLAPNCFGNKNSYGTISLAKEGGMIATCGNDILKYICDDSQQQFEDTYRNRAKKNNSFLESMLEKLDSSSRAIFECLRENGDLSSSQIAIITKINIIRVNQILTELELEDLIGQVGFNKYKVLDELCE